MTESTRHRALRWVPPRLALAALALGLGCGTDPLPPADGTLSIEVETSGESIDVDGFTITVGGQSMAIGATGSTSVDVPAGSYDVTIGDVAPNCVVQGSATQSVTVSDGAGVMVSFQVVCAFDGAGVALSEISCPGLVPGSAEGVPLDRVTVGSVPTSLSRPLLARMAWSGDTRIATAVTFEEGGQLELTIPIHPSGSMEGGDVTVRVTDEARSCPPFTFTILPLPAADGELEALADVAQGLLDRQAVLFGTSRAELTDTPIGALAPGLRLLAVAQTIVDDPASTNTLRAAVEGTDPELEPEDLDFAERLIARTGLLDDLQAELADLDAAAGRAGARPRSAGPSRDVPFSPGLALECVTSADDLEAELLDQCMTLGRDKIQGSASAETQNTAINALDFAAIVSSRIAKPIGSLVKFSALYDEALAGNLPTSFASIEVTPAPAVFLEDQPGPGDWSPANVFATSTGWNLEGLLAELVGRRITPEARPTARRLGPRERRLLLRAIGNNVGTIENAFQYLVDQLFAALIDKGLSLTDSILTVPPITYGPVDITDTRWSDARIVTGTSVELGTPHQLVQPREPGTSLLEVITAVGAFGGTSIATEHLPISVDTISITVEPEELVMMPGQDTVFTVRVEGALFPDSVEAVAPSQGTSSLEVGEGGVHRLAYTAPGTPAPGGSSVLVGARHTARGGARQGGAEIGTSAVVRFGGVRIIPVTECVELDEELQLEADIVGFESEPNLIWSSNDVQISPSGLMVPDQAGIVTVVVEVEGQPGFRDTLEIAVGGCSCSGTIVADGQTDDTNLVIFFLNDALTAVEGIRWWGVNFGTAGFSFGEADSDAIEIPIGQTGAYPALVSGVIGTTTFLNVSDPDREPIPALTLNVTENSGSVFAGRVTGPVRIPADPEWRTSTMSFDFYIEADPDFSDPDAGRCEVNPN